jgi:hypothetical protein
MCTYSIVISRIVDYVTTSFVIHVAGRYEAGVLLPEAGRLLVRLRESQQEKAGETIFIISSTEMVSVRVQSCLFRNANPNPAALKSVKKFCFSYF